MVWERDVCGKGEVWSRREFDAYTLSKKNRIPSKLATLDCCSVMNVSVPRELGLTDAELLKGRVPRVKPPSSEKPDTYSRGNMVLVELEERRAMTVMFGAGKKLQPQGAAGSTR